ncbi:DNA repair protein RecO [Mycoplasmopsis maculosa]|nr:DNA repair protein RecO [Mycoplasmopsis maculosa]
MAEKIIEAIVLRIEDYYENDNDSLVTFLTKNGLIKVYSKGINKPISKNRNNLIIGSLVEIEYFEARIKNKISKLKKARIKIMPNFNDISILKLIKKSVIFLSNFYEKCENVFNAYKTILEKQNDIQSSYLFTYLLAQSLDYFGIKPITEYCYNCKTPGNLCDFEFYKGGFICGDCSNKKRWTKELKSFYYLFKDLNTFVNVVTPEINKLIYNELIIYLKDNGIYLNY